MGELVTGSDVETLDFGDDSRTSLDQTWDLEEISDLVQEIEAPKNGQDVDDLPQDFRSGRTPRPNDVFIAVMGVTGSGKSSFISLLCSGRKATIGHTLEACTAIVDVYAYDMSPDRTVFLIDTPGFDDTNKSDTEVLSEIAAWLGNSYKSKILLHGIIYIHRITDIRMQGSAKKNLLMFKQLCGENALKRVILVTTMWDKIASEEGEKREAELVNTPEFWGWMLAKGSSCRRHQNTEESAKELVLALAGHDHPFATELQKQLIDENMTLDETSAGRELQSALLREQERWAKRLQEVEEQMKAAMQQRDQEAEETLKEVRDEYTDKIKKVKEDTVALRSNMENLLAQRDKRVAKMHEELKESKKQLRDSKTLHAEELKKLNERIHGLEKKQEKKKIPAEIFTISKLKPWSSGSSKMMFSVTMVGYHYVCISHRNIKSNSGFMSKLHGRGQLQAVSLGGSNENGTTWVARYSDSFQTSSDLETEYPKLKSKIDAHGTDGLKMCILGPYQTYYARWKDRWNCHAYDDPTEAFRLYYSKQPDGVRVTHVALGYDSSYVIAFKNGNGVKPSRGLTWNLQGHYPALQKTLASNPNIKIVAITLNTLNHTDFILIWKENGPKPPGKSKKSKGSIYKMQCYSQYTTVLVDLTSWWNER